MEDAVSRHRLLSDLKELIVAWEKYPVMAEQIKGVEAAIGYVELIPSAQPERKIHFADADHVWIDGKQYISLGRFQEAVVEAQPERKKDVIQSFRDYQIEWLTSHCDLELEPVLESWVVRFLHDTANCYMMEVEHE